MRRIPGRHTIVSLATLTRALNRALQETANRLLRLQLAETTNSFRAAMATAQTFLEQGAYYGTLNGLSIVTCFRQSR